MSSGLISSWHRFNLKGAKFIRQVPVDETPQPIHEDGFTDWKRGMGPIVKQHYEPIPVAIFKDVPKPKTKKKYIRRKSKKSST